ncbi:hypothetical protein [Flexivirga oryzae]|uniref:Uncharacterized protein n=1 Tax=Flexivirga oryzae TaxID=1794944 RepID=A0A839N9X9_9MICO|nr:hypothetical protein [Flexivirga oryzae]MBB2894560.1 hypothetical protein [Flexivirga oryzae]
MTETTCAHPSWCTLNHEDPIVEQNTHEGYVQRGSLVDAWIYSDAEDERDSGIRFGVQILNSDFSIPGDATLLDRIINELNTARDALVQTAAR